MRNLYITLLSDSSLDIYPTNKGSQFTNQLLAPIMLEPDMEVGLAEVSYVKAFQNIDTESKITIFDFFYENEDKTWGKIFDAKLKFCLITSIAQYR